MFSLSSNFLRSTTIIQSWNWHAMERCCWYPLLILPVTTIIYSCQLLMYLFHLKLIYEFKSWGDFIVYFPLTRVSISLSSLLSTELKMICFEVKMTGCDKHYHFHPRPPHVPPKRHTHPNLPKPERKTTNCQIT